MYIKLTNSEREEIIYDPAFQIIPSFALEVM